MSPEPRTEAARGRVQVQARIDATVQEHDGDAGILCLAQHFIPASGDHRCHKNGINAEPKPSWTSAQPCPLIVTICCGPGVQQGQQK